MFKEYKHLSIKDRRRLEFFKKSRNFTKKFLKLILISTGIILLFIIGMFSFYKFLDETNSSNKFKNFSNKINSKFKVQNENSDLDELSKKELERETEKESSISDSSKKEDYEFEANAYNFSEWNKTAPEELMVVNFKNSISEDYKVKTKNCRGKEINSIACQDLEQMIADAQKDGARLWISSGYRDIKRQTMLFKRQVERELSKEVISQEEAELRASKIVAKPCTSEHNTGLAVDFNGVCDDFYKTKEYKWLMDNADKYGFIERYQEKWKELTGVIYEPWHFRYVGKEEAPKIKESGLCLEEYIKNKIGGKI